MRQKFTDLIADLGFCCPRAFFEANRKVRTGVLADRLGLNERTVRYHRQGQGRCINAPSCLIKGAKGLLKQQLERRLK